MFVCNIKLNGTKLFKIIFTIIFIIAFVLLCFSLYKVFYHSSNTKDELNLPETSNITSQDYTNILKEVHDNLDNYVGQKVNITGYVYRLYDFETTQFVIARDMIISSDQQSLVVGFLCNYKKAADFEDGTWVNITGKITKGNYHGDIPILEITEMKQCDKPNDEFVYPPDDTYIPTSVIY